MFQQTIRTILQEIEEMNVIDLDYDDLDYLEGEPTEEWLTQQQEAVFFESNPY